VNLGRQVKGASIVASAIKQCDGFKSCQSSLRKWGVATKERNQAFDSSAGIIDRHQSRTVDQRAWILSPRSGAFKERTPLVAAIAVVENVEQHKQRFVRLR
jgi:hypothetical protein